MNTVYMSTFTKMKRGMKPADKARMFSLHSFIPALEKNDSNAFS